ADLLQEARRALLSSPPVVDRDITRARETVERLSEEIIARNVVERGTDVSREEVKWLAKYLGRFMAGLGILDILLADERVQDIYIDSPAGEIPVYLNHRDHAECVTNIFLTQTDIDSLVSKFRAMSGRPFSEADPVLDMDIQGVRVAVVGPPLSPWGVAMALRRHKPTPWTLPQFIDVGFMTPKAAAFLSLLVDAQASILITGSRGSGKTSLLSALMLELLPRYRILTVEDTLELPVEHLRRLGFKIQPFRVQSVTSSTDVEMSAGEALRAALRLGESVLVIGEVRGEEARTLYEAMRVGTAGNSVLGTIHGATAKDVFERVVYDLGIHPSSFKATDVIVVAAPVRSRGRVERVRKLFQVTEVRKAWRKDPAAERGFTDLFSFDYCGMEAKPTPALSRSELVFRIARKWATTVENVLKNLEFREMVMKTLVERARNSGSRGLLEADFVVRSNLFWRGLLEDELGKKNISYRRVFREWLEWLESHEKE
ncbi:MAG: type II/IV secretion system ATPase subunit, partial [Candidatus Hadarchaeales archaeon]